MLKSYQYKQWQPWTVSVVGPWDWMKQIQFQTRVISKFFFKSHCTGKLPQKNEWNGWIKNEFHFI